MVEKDVTTIQISKMTREKLKQFGKKGETYDEIIERMFKLMQIEGVGK